MRERDSDFWNDKSNHIQIILSLLAFNVGYMWTCDTWFAISSFFKLLFHHLIILALRLQSQHFQIGPIHVSPDKSNQTEKNITEKQTFQAVCWAAFEDKHITGRHCLWHGAKLNG